MHTRIFTLHSFGSAPKPLGHQVLGRERERAVDSNLVDRNQVKSQLSNRPTRLSLSKQASINDWLTNAKGHAGRISISGNAARVFTTI